MGPIHDKPYLASDSKWDDAQALAVITEHSHLDGALLPILHALQATFGYVDARCVPAIADKLNISKADVHGVISFYHDFRHAPAGRHVLKLCRAESCQAMGCEKLVDHLAHTHHLGMGDTDATGAITVETVYCLGNCALSPAALLDDELIGRLDATKLDAIVMNATGMRS